MGNEISALSKAQIRKRNQKTLFWCCFFGVIFLASIKMLGFFVEPDYFWHVKLGEWMVENKSMMGRDVFSWSAQYYPINEFAHSWASSILIYGFHTLFATASVPLLGAYVYQAVFVCITSFLLFSLCKKGIKDIGETATTSVMMFLVPIICCLPVTARPYMIGNICFLIMLWVLDRIKKAPQSRAHFAIPVIALIWANFHGGTILMLPAFCAGYFLVGLLRFSAGQLRQEKSPREIQKKYLFGFVSGILASLINPYGYKLLIYPFIINNAAAKENVMEWFPSTISNGFGMALIVVAGAIIIFSNTKYTLYSALPLFATVGLTLMHVRGAAYLSMAMAFFFAMEFRFSKKELRLKWGPQFPLFAVISVLTLAAAVFFAPSIIGSANAPVVEPEMIQAIKDEDFERLYSGYNPGGELIYNGIPVFIDSRADLYPEGVLRDGKKLQFLSCDPEATISKYMFDGLLAEQDTPLTYYLLGNPNYRLVYSSEGFALFERLPTAGFFALSEMVINADK